MRSPMKRGFTLIELLVVIAIIAILASILFPVFAKAREKARQATCTSQVRQLATAVQMYVQDNQSQYPGIDGPSWVNKLTQYVGNSEKLFQCPSDLSGDSNKVSYALNGLLIRSNGTGVKEAAVLSPSEVGAICDATPSSVYPEGRLIGNGGQQAEETFGAKPDARHAKGAIAGFCDGHAKYFQTGAIDENSLHDMSNEITRAFYGVASMGLIDNPAGQISELGTPIAGTGTAILGGEYAVKPFIDAAASLYTNGTYSRGYLGMDNYTPATRGNNYAWGKSGTGPIVADTDHSAIAFDAMVVIVSKGTRIPSLGSLNSTYRTYLATTTSMRNWLRSGYVANSVQSYKMPSSTGSTQYINNVLGFTTFGADTIQVSNDMEMVEKVANDPYGIGYCSSVYADPDRVMILGIDWDSSNAYNDGDKIWPSTSTKFRWVLPSFAESSWPWKRWLDVESSDTNTTGGGAGIVNALHSSSVDSPTVANLLSAGPLFKMGYWPGNYAR